jgi:mRNA interferase HigB
MGTRYTPGVRVIAPSTLTRLVESLPGRREQPAVKSALQAWFHEAVRADWGSSTDVKKSYPNASILDAERVVFNIKGNDYRLVTAIDYRRKIVFIKWLGTHAAYDKIDARTVQYGDQADQDRCRPRRHFA